MPDSLGSRRYAVCPACGSRYPVPATLDDGTARLLALDHDPPALWDRGVIFCGNCGAAFRPDVAHRLGADAMPDVAYVVAGGPPLKRDLAPTDVPCEVSRQWLRFRPDSHRTQAGEFMFIDVMTALDDDHGTGERKLCEVIVTREDLLRALETVRPRSDER